MQKVLLLLFFFLLNGCSLDSLLALGEVDKTQVVKHTPYVKHYRAYFTRTHLKPIKNGKKYLYFYNSKAKDLSVLLHRKNQYILYSLYHPNKKAIVINTNRKTRYSQIVKSLKHKGYRLTSLATIGCTSHVGLRRYKGIKTLLIEVKDHSRLQKAYKKAIKTYNAKGIRSIKTKLPKQLIYSYYKHYHKRAKTQKQSQQLEIIARKLQLSSAKAVVKPVKKDSKKVPKKAKREKEKVKVEVEKEKVPEPEPEAEEVEIIEVIEKPIETHKPYNYYLEKASYYELNSYLSTGGARDHLTYNQYNNLKAKRAKQKEERLLQHGSLEELISAYKKNKDPRYKTRILILMKKVQKTKE